MKADRRVSFDLLASAPTAWRRRTWTGAFRPSVALLSLLFATASAAAEPGDLSALQQSYEATVLPLVKQLCFDCHSGDVLEADVDLAAFESFAAVRRGPRIWVKVREMLDTGQMPPKDAEQPSDSDRTLLQTWVRDYLTTEATVHAGDPGRVVLRRLNNAQYTYTIRDLTGVTSLTPAEQFPVDGAAGEGFTNTGNALVMSPALVTKYLDAAKDLAEHMVLLPDGVRFSPSTSRRDWTNETLDRIRDFYRRFTESGGGTAVNLQGIQFETNQGGRLPIEAYLAVSIVERDKLTSGSASPEAVATEFGLNPKYFATLWHALSPALDAPPSLLVDRLRSRWRDAKPDDVAALTAEIDRWQQALWKFNSIGHIGRHLGGKLGPATWLEAVTPLADHQDVRLKLEAAPGEKEITLYLVAGDAADGNQQDFVVWHQPRLVAAGRPDLALRDLPGAVAALANHREQVASSAAKCLAAAAEVGEQAGAAELDELATKHGVDPAILAGWLESLGMNAGPTTINSYITQKSESTSGYGFIQGWIGADALSVVANSSDEHVRIPGNMAPHSVAVHPAPTQKVIIGWRSPGGGHHAHRRYGAARPSRMR